MQLLVAPAEAHPALEKASWIVAIIAFTLIILQLIFYWFGRRFPLQIQATGEIVKFKDGQQLVLLLDVEFRSRTRDSQTVRELLLLEPPNLLRRTLWPWWYFKDLPATRATEPQPEPVKIDGHDSNEMVVTFLGSELPYGARTRLKVRASRKQPYVVNVQMGRQPNAGNEDTSASDRRETSAGKGNLGLSKNLTLCQAVTDPTGAALTEGEDMTSPPTKMQIPADAVLTTGDDILQPLNDLLGAKGLNLKGSQAATDKAGSPSAVFGGPPQSVALIEAGATAVSKWWATGLGVTVAGVWAAVSGWWSGQDPASQRVALWVAAIVTAAAIFGIAYLLGSDVRGRSIASVATIRARAQVADSLVQASQAAFIPTPPAPSAELVALPAPLEVSYSLKSSADEPGWKAVALFSNGTDITKYLIAKGAEHEWVDATSVMLVPPA